MTLGLRISWTCRTTGLGSTWLKIPSTNLCACPEPKGPLARHEPGKGITDKDCGPSRGDGRLLDGEQCSGQQRRVAAGMGEEGGLQR